MSFEKKIKKREKIDVDIIGETKVRPFVKRPVPSNKEVDRFEKIVERESRDQEIDTNLLEIYSNKTGAPIDVQRMKIKKRNSLFVRFLKKILAFFIIFSVIYGVYYYFKNSGNVNSVDFEVSAPEKLLAGEEFSYLVSYRNKTKFNLSKIHLEMQYPENFIFSSSTIAPSNGNSGWDLPDLASGASANLTITGKIIALADSANVVFGRLSYTPANISSELKKESSISTIISGAGFNVDLDYSNTAFLKQENDLTLIISNIENNYLGDFDISFSLPAETNASVVSEAGQDTASSSLVSSSSPVIKKVTIVKNGGSLWQVGGLNQELGRQEIPLIYKINTKIAEPEIKIRLEKRLNSGQTYVFWEKSIKPELISSDLNLTLKLNDSKNDGAVSFGQPLNYSLSYANHGSNSYKDVVIMAVLDGDLLNWNTLKDENKGTVENKTISWTKNEIPQLAEIKPGQEGVIDFSINLSSFKDGDLNRDLKIVSYGQYGMNNKTIKGSDNKSNIITSKFNSDLSLNERILYFNDDNLPVGSGPLPPMVGQTTSFKVYWTVTNNLHELTDARAVFILPAGVIWDGRHNTNVGNLYYDEVSRQVIWEIGRLPISVYRADAEFSISITPSESDRNKLLVLSPGSMISAMDRETMDVINLRINSKTTKLEDDDIAGLNNSGIVQ